VFILLFCEGIEGVFVSMDCARYFLLPAFRRTWHRTLTNSHESHLAACQKSWKSGGLIVGVQRETASGGSYVEKAGIARLWTLEKDEAAVLLML
jgi:hypothetical protein